MGSEIRGTEDDRSLANTLRRLGQDYFRTLTPEQRREYNRSVWGNNSAVLGGSNNFSNAVGFMDRFIVDLSCKVVPFPGESLICGRYIHRWDATPIGLVFDEEVARTQMSVVEFDLDPHDGATYPFSTWRASAGFPLLVFDPGHKGIVNSAHQLFGRWAFGGREGSDTAGNAKPWRDGYQALASLDSDGDGSLTGGELKDIALWFDRDSDGVSDEGEVQQAHRVGIRRLATRFDRTDEATGDLIATDGFERETAEGIQLGRSIDWMAVSGGSKSELVEALKRRASAVVDHTGAQEMSAEQSTTTMLPSTDLVATVVGRWRWSLEQELTDEFGTEGVFELVKSKTTLRGKNIVLRPLADPMSGNVVREVQILPLSGVRVSGSPRGSEITFSVRSHDGSIIENTAFIDPQTGVMHGRARQLFSGAADSAAIQYSWTAHKIQR
jgi:hypothetical protein